LKFNSSCRESELRVVGVVKIIFGSQFISQ
jgi:hypothetical protein